jgi:glycosyl hydrolase family 20
MEELAISGLMLDMVRVTERPEHYMYIARAASGWGYNTLFAHLTDDDGCAMTFKNRPELATPHAMTQEQIREWIGTAKDHGLSIVPEIECFGHTRFIHTLPKYKHLAIRGIGPHNAIHPLHPETHTLIEDLLRDTAELFDSPYIHAGFDEVNLGDGSALGPEAAGKADWEVFADYVTHVHGIITKLGKQMMIWGDHLVSEPRIGDRIPKDIIICDWQYHADLDTSTTHTLLDMGFKVVCCPSSSRSGDMIMPRSNTLGNLQRFSRIAHAAGEHVLGLINTIWCPGRMLCDTELFTLALGGAWFNDPEVDPLPIVSRFVTERYGIDPPEVLAEAILRLSTLMPHNSLPRRIMQTETSKKAPPSPVTASEAREMREVAKAIEPIRSVFESLSGQVKQNERDYRNFLLACDLIDWWDRLAQARLAVGAGADTKALAERGEHLIQRCNTDWKRRRYDDDSKRDHDTYAETDGLITNLVQAVAGLKA